MQKPNISVEVLPLSDVNAKEDLSGTHKAAQNPPDTFQMTPMLRNGMKSNGFSMILK